MSSNSCSPRAPVISAAIINAAISITEEGVAGTEAVSIEAMATGNCGAPKRVIQDLRSNESTSPTGPVCFCVEEAIVSHDRTGEGGYWFCGVDRTDPRCLRLDNTKAIDTPDSCRPGEILVALIETGVRVAFPNNYVVLVTRLLLSSDSIGGGSPFLRIANGVVDAGYRGTIRLVVYYDGSITKIPPNALSVRLALVKLSDDQEIQRRILFDLYDASNYYECGGKFIESVRDATVNCSPETQLSLLRLPPDNAKIWPGTQCESMVVITSDAAAATTQYIADTKQVSFAVKHSRYVVLGLYKVPDDKEAKPSIMFSSCGKMSTLRPFFDTFNRKRLEDAGYDIPLPRDLELQPRTFTEVKIRQIYNCKTSDVLPCIFGRSSMNAKGLTVLPTRWLEGEWLTFLIYNFTRKTVFLNAGDRVAQLVLISRDANLWIPPHHNYSDPCPPAMLSTSAPYVTYPSPVWRFTLHYDTEAMTSERREGGFGSTGI